MPILINKKDVQMIHTSTDSRHDGLWHQTRNSRPSFQPLVNVAHRPVRDRIERSRVDAAITTTNKHVYLSAGSRDGICGQALGSGDVQTEPLAPPTVLVRP